jgi:hypothetical protein
MAIDFELIEAADLGKFPGGRQPILEMPGKVTRVTAAGGVVLSPGYRAYQVRNIGDTVFMRVGLTSDAAAPAAADGKSIRMIAGTDFAFTLPDDANPALYTLRVAVGA